MDGERLRTWREDRAMSQADLARLLDVRAATISDWERGARGILMPRMLELALRALAQERDGVDRRDTGDDDES